MTLKIDPLLDGLRRIDEAHERAEWARKQNRRDVWTFCLLILVAAFVAWVGAGGLS